MSDLSGLTMAVSVKGARLPSAERHGQILDAAMEEFVLRGYVGARMAAVASRAGVTKGLLYHYFPGGKVDLFKSAIGTCLGPALAEAGRMAGDFQGSGGDLLRALIELGYPRVEMEQREYILLKLLLTEADRFPELAEFYRAEILQPALALVRGAVQAGVASGEFRAGAADEPGLAYVLLAPIFMGSIWRMMLAVDGAPDIRALREAHLELALRGLRP